VCCTNGRAGPSVLIPLAWKLWRGRTWGHIDVCCLCLHSLTKEKLILTIKIALPRSEFKLEIHLRTHSSCPVSSLTPYFVVSWGQTGDNGRARRKSDQEIRERPRLLRTVRNCSARMLTGLPVPKSVHQSRNQLVLTGSKLGNKRSTAQSDQLTACNVYPPSTVGPSECTQTLPISCSRVRNVFALYCEVGKCP